MDHSNLFPSQAFKRMDERPDAEFYAFPRLVTHIDEAAIRAVTFLYKQYFPANTSVLDLMSSWISHLPSDVDYSKVVGLGMNETELQANPRLHDFVVQDLNVHPILPFEDNTFDNGAICVSIDYLTQPIQVLQEMGRVMKAQSPLVITFSNRCFPSKAIAMWLSLNDTERVKLVAKFLEVAGNWEDIAPMDCSPQGIVASDPLYAVVARVKKA